MEDAGFHWYYSLLASLTIYTGAFQFVLITFLSSGASLITVVVTAFLMNSRQAFYSLSFVSEFQKMGRKKWYMVHTMTDETYAVNCTLKKGEQDSRDIMLSRCYWMIGAVLGGIIGQLIPFDLEGVDFCMTALFVIIFIDRWEKSNNHFPAIAGIIVSVICLIIFGETLFMLPSLIIVSGILVLRNSLQENKP